jgi:Holliday junction resolvase RusA-like endonuclease
MILILDYPDMALSPNRKNGKYWGSTINAKKNARDTAYYATKAQLKGTLPDANWSLKITYMQTDKRHRDLDNLLSASKHAIDGMAKALNVDDKRFRPITLDVAYGDKAQMIVEIN